MTDEKFKNKLVAVLNKSIEPGKVMNALAHMCIGLGSAIGKEAMANNIMFNDFTDTMTVGAYKEQIERTAQVKDQSLIYNGIVLFGDWDKVTELTRKCSLWK